MHEASLIRSLLRQVHHLGLQHQATSIDDIEVAVGPLSGVEPLLLESAFERLRGSTSLCQNATLSIRPVELEVLCLACQATTQIDDFRFMCRDCGSTSLRVLQGDSLQLRNVRMQIPDTATDLLSEIKT